MNTRRMMLLLPLIALASCGGHGESGGASTLPGVMDASAQPAPASRPLEGTPVRNGPYVVCSVGDYEPDDSPTLARGFTLNVGDKIDIDGEAVTGNVGFVASVRFHRDSNPPATLDPSVTLDMVGCCDRQRLAAPHRLGEREPLRLITITDETKRYSRFPGKFCPDITTVTKKTLQNKPQRLITVRFCYQRLDTERKPAWECPPGADQPHGGDVHAVNP